MVSKEGNPIPMRVTWKIKRGVQLLWGANFPGVDLIFWGVS